MDSVKFTVRVEIEIEVFGESLKGLDHAEELRERVSAVMQHHDDTLARNIDLILPWPFACNNFAVDDVQFAEPDKTTFRLMEDEAIEAARREQQVLKATGERERL